MLDKILKKYTEFYKGKSYSDIATLIRESELNVRDKFSHRTLRRKISEYVNQCCGDTTGECDVCLPKGSDFDLDKPIQSRPDTIPWNQERVAKWFMDNDFRTPSSTFQVLGENSALVKVDTNTQLNKLITQAQALEIGKRNKASDILKELAEYPMKPSECFQIIKPFKGDKKNVLVVGDIHEPFCRADYLQHCLETQKRFNCGKVVFIGDVIDSHYSSFHAQDPDGFGAGEELDRAICKIGDWYQAFPKAQVTLGNHDLIIMRKAFASGLSSKWIKGLGEVLDTPNWEYGMQFTIDNVLYTHTLGGKLILAAMNRRQSTVAGHLHTNASIEYNVSAVDRIFAMQVGCGIDDEAYAFAYAKLNSKKSIICCGVVQDSGTLPILVPMKL